MIINIVCNGNGDMNSKMNQTVQFFQVLILGHNMCIRYMLKLWVLSAPINIFARMECGRDCPEELDIFLKVGSLVSYPWVAVLC